MAPMRPYEPEFPELVKQAEIVESGKAETVQEFIDWLSGQGIVLAEWRDDGWHQPALLEDNRSPEQLMADFFGIDRDKIEQERQALLEAIRREAEPRGEERELLLESHAQMEAGEKIPADSKHDQDDCDCEWPTDDEAVDPEDEGETFVHLEEIRELGTEEPVGYVLHPEPGQRFVQITGTVVGYFDLAVGPPRKAALEIELDEPLPRDMHRRRMNLRVVAYVEDVR
jgi:hypothetical protein